MRQPEPNRRPGSDDRPDGADGTNSPDRDPARRSQGPDAPNRRSGHEGIPPDGERSAGRRRDRIAELERRIERLETVVRAVEHDVRGALVVGNSHLEAARSEPAADRFDGIEHAHDRIETLLADLRTAASGGTPDRDRGPVAVGTLAREAWAGIDAPAAALTVEDDPTVVADDARLLRLLENLLRNAVEHGSRTRGSTAGVADGTDSVDREAAIRVPSPAPGDAVPAVTAMEGGTAPDPTVSVGALDGSGFYVADDGPGIPPAERGRVFEPGYSTDANGTGLGLAIVRDVVEEHGWTIRLTEGEAGGARIEVSDGETHG